MKTQGDEEVSEAVKQLLSQHEALKVSTCDKGRPKTSWNLCKKII